MMPIFFNVNRDLTSNFISSLLGAAVIRILGAGSSPALLACGVEDNALYHELYMRMTTIGDIIGSLYKLWHKTRVVSGGPVWSGMDEWTPRFLPIVACDKFSSACRSPDTLRNGDETRELEKPGDFVLSGPGELFTPELLRTAEVR
jgi:hypothetical protein